MTATITHTRTKHIEYNYVFHRHIIAFLHLGTLDSPSAPHLRDILNSTITNKKHKDAKSMAPKDHENDTCLQHES